MIPETFPNFIVPGREAEMASLRRLMWLHYVPAGPLATLWDEWISGPSLWPALRDERRMHTIRDRWRTALAGRIMDPEGYVATHQHASIAHQLGWPFPFWAQGGPKTWGWHFSLEGVPGGWHGTEEKTQEGWTLDNAADEGIHDGAWNLSLTGPGASAATPAFVVDVLQSPFLQLRWKANGLGNAQPYIEWTTNEAPAFGPERRMYFPPVESDAFVYTMIPVFKHPEWRGEITRLRIQFGNRDGGSAIGIQALFTQYDTRHNINNANFVRGCANYFLWTRDVNFLREQIDRMRTAVRYVMTEYRTVEEHVVVTSYVGHCGRSGVRWDDQGNKATHPGVGIGNNYWDLLPMGHKDAYATLHFYDALGSMAAIERAVAAHPEWDVPAGVLTLDPQALDQHAADLKRKGNQVFWNDATGRFVCGIDVDGHGHDYGFTFLNLEAVYYDFATPEHAESIMRWVCGERTVAGDTSQGEDIYHWRFGPRATTKRNIDYYGWFWSRPETIPWGGQVQDGGAVLGFSYHDLMARLKTRGADNAAQRLAEVLEWFDDVTDAGGYRAYYDGTREGTLQGEGTAGGLGLDKEFFESLLVPQVVLDGFLGFEPTAEGFRVNPQLPSAWPELAVTRIHLHRAVLTLRAMDRAIEVTFEEAPPADAPPLTVELPRGPWRACRKADGDWRPCDGRFAHLPQVKGVTYRLERTS